MPVKKKWKKIQSNVHHDEWLEKFKKIITSVYVVCICHDDDLRCLTPTFLQPFMTSARVLSLDSRTKYTWFMIFISKRVQILFLFSTVFILDLPIHYDVNQSTIPWILIPYILVGIMTFIHMCGPVAAKHLKRRDWFHSGLARIKGDETSCRDEIGSLGFRNGHITISFANTARMTTQTGRTKR